MMKLSAENSEIIQMSELVLQLEAEQLRHLGDT